MQRHHLLHPNTHGVAIQPLAIRGQQGTANLHNPALGARHFAAHLLPTLARDFQIRDTKTPLTIVA
ncbi:hypothetical protein, partial [Pseudomonas savastanoi]|uniref:hypothetical protein n=1 Tax=Pseudomonas savastanoi TaxID=29438 RepID=UPI001F3D5DB5